MAFVSSFFVFFAFAIRFIGAPISLGLFIYGIVVSFRRDIELGLILVASSMVLAFATQVCAWLLLAVAESLANAAQPNSNHDAGNASSQKRIRKNHRTEQQRIAPTLDKEVSSMEIAIGESSEAASMESTEFVNPNEVIELHMQLMQAPLTKRLGEQVFEFLSTEQVNRFLAFELGVIEYFAHEVVKIDESGGDAQFGNFVLAYANHKYDYNSEEVFNIWWSFATNGKYFREREIGFNSLNDRYNEEGTPKLKHDNETYLDDALFPQRYATNECQ